jgi:hypothetical protein
MWDLLKSLSGVYARMETLVGRGTALPAAHMPDILLIKYLIL